MRKITITLDERTARWARMYAAASGKSVSRLVGEILKERMSATRNYENAMRQYLTKKPVKFRWLDGTRPMRDELHNREGLR